MEHALFFSEYLHNMYFGVWAKVAPSKSFGSIQVFTAALNIILPSTIIISEPSLMQ